MNIFRQLMQKPWVPAQGEVDNLHVGGEFAVSKAKVGLRIFFVVVSVLFLLLVIAYGERMEAEQWRPSPQPALLWLSTALLILASLGMQWALVGVRHGRLNAVKVGMILGGVFAFAFLGSQALAWRQLNAMTAFDITNPAIAFFYLITALHGLHLIGGLAAWGRTAMRIWQVGSVEEAQVNIELCTAYWHFLLAVWIVLFALLFSGNDNLATLLSISGIR